MNNEDFWQAYVGDVPPGQFMYDYGAREPERCVARHMAKLPDVFGIVRQQSWAEAFAGVQHTRQEVASALLAHLEASREHWEAAVSQMPEQHGNRDGEAPSAPEASSNESNSGEQVHPQQIQVPHRPQHHGSAILSRDHGGLPREHTAKESPYFVGGLPINTPLDQRASIEDSLARSAPMFHAPEQELPLGTAVDQDLPLEKRPMQSVDDLHRGEVAPAEASAPESPAVDALQDKVDEQFPSPESDASDATTLPSDAEGNAEIIAEAESVESTSDPSASEGVDPQPSENEQRSDEQSPSTS